MFGLEDQKKKKPNQEFFFDIEKDLKDLAKRKEITEKVAMRLQKIQECLHSGSESDEFQTLGTLLHGYNSFLKVISRCGQKK